MLVWYHKTIFHNIIPQFGDVVQINYSLVFGLVTISIASVRFGFRKLYRCGSLTFNKRRSRRLPAAIIASNSASSFRRSPSPLAPSVCRRLCDTTERIVFCRKRLLVRGRGSHPLGPIAWARTAPRAAWLANSSTARLCSVWGQ